ncbi:response regulator transcription factor [Mycolicibacterium sp.]|uniref:response regulator transcription factor n=1 Tax=Mycolicibacterium sp. TaxID=2320850 RepID=UPI001A2974DB|nr:response regulator transcription factor [Mycolicibacterium sp.]MBJ7341588.1 response regulator transcription factor [Mycolicibacterium sp.]
MPATLGQERPSICIIDDHDVVHAGIRSWCSEATPPVDVAGSYDSVDAFLTDHPTPSADLGVVVLDLELRSREPAFDALERIVAAGHKVVVYSHIDQGEVILRCLDVGALTYLVKSEGQRHLLDAIRAAWTDTPFVGPQMAGAICQDVRGERPRLGEREREVLIAWFQTESKELVGRQLHIEPTTVRTHLQRVRAKYAAAGRPAPTKAALVARAVQDGLISINDL